MASPENPLDRPPAPVEPETPAFADPPLGGALSTPDPAMDSGVGLQPAPRKPAEDPPWTIWEVVALGLATFVLVTFSFVIVNTLAHHFIAPRSPWFASANRPEVILISQVLAYCLVLLLMYWLAGAHGGRPTETLHWNWPRHGAIFLWYGILLSIALQGFARFLPMPKTVPMDQFFETPVQAWLLSIFAITLAPLVEELFFRGFLYPALARPFGVPLSILLTGLAFGGIHALQLGFYWGPVLVIVVVGIVLTAVRAYTKSVGRTVLMHIGYNLTITVATYYTTDAFRHLDKLKQ